MSVAFRRDGDEEHLEPKFELPIPPGPNLVTTRGKALIDAKVAALAAELATLTDVLTNVLADELAVAATRRQLRYWQTRQITAEPVPAPTGQTVEIGTRVTFRRNGQDRVLGIVGDDEADPAAGLIAFSAPLARALLGAQTGDRVDFAGKEEAIEVRAITVLPGI